MVTVAVLLPPRVLTVQVTPANELEALQLKLTLPEKLLIGVKVSVDVPLLPGLIVKVLGEALREKSGPPPVKLDTLDQAAIWPLPGGARACTSQ
jgi:hypothetical protein